MNLLLRERWSKSPATAQAPRPYSSPTIPVNSGTIVGYAGPNGSGREVLNLEDWETRFPAEKLRATLRDARSKPSKADLKKDKDIAVKRERALEGQVKDLRSIAVRREYALPLSAEDAKDFQSEFPFHLRWSARAVARHMARSKDEISWEASGTKMRETVLGGRAEKSSKGSRSKVGRIAIAALLTAGVVGVGANALLGGDDETPSSASTQTSGDQAGGNGKVWLVKDAVACAPRSAGSAIATIEAADGTDPVQAPLAAMERAAGTPDVADDFSYMTSMTPDVATVFVAQVKSAHEQTSGTILTFGPGAQFAVPIQCETAVQ